MYRASQFSLFLFFRTTSHVTISKILAEEQNKINSYNSDFLNIYYFLQFLEIEGSDIMEKHHTKVVGKVFCGLFMRLVFHTN